MTYVLLFLLSVVAPASLWSIVRPWDNFHNDKLPIANFLGEQNNRKNNFATSSYADLNRIPNLFDNYTEDQQLTKLTDVINNYIEGVKVTGREIIDTWSYVPGEDPDSLLENPDVTLSVPAIIGRNGYNCEIHTVVSQGYILNLHRIPHSKNSKHVSSKTVFLQHGLFASSADWILNGPEKGMAYVLANAGYDVWMANIRGNRYSKEHAWLKTTSKAYWDFSWHDVALHDVPALIDYILNIKGTHTKITYVGHSMGTTILFAMLTLRPEYNRILSAGFAIAPVVFMSDLKSPIKSLAPIANNLASIDMLQGNYELIPKTSTLGKMSSSCDAAGIDNFICKNMAFYICGYNEKQFNKSVLPVFLAHLGTGTSWKTVVHFSQEINNYGRFQHFDYGYYYNVKLYGSVNSPEYDLSRITLPIKLFWSKNDLLSSKVDVTMLYNRLPRKPDTYLILDPDFNHLDYLWGIDAPKLVNDELLKSLYVYMP